MSTKQKISAAVIAVAIALAIWMSLPPTQPPVTPPNANDAAKHASAAEAQADKGTDSSSARVDAASTDEVERDAAEVESPTTGTVHVRVKWAVDDLPAANVSVYLSGNRAGKLAVTDDTGLAQFTAVAPGRHYTNILRPDVMDFEPELEQPKFEVTAGVTTEVELTVPDSLDVTGIVVDAQDQPVADAEVTVGLSDIVVAKTGAGGRFEARDLALRFLIGVRAGGLAPSDLRSVQGSVGGSVDLRFVLDKPSAHVTGIVLGPDAKPIAGARVTIGKRVSDFVRFADGSTGQGPPCSRRRTDQHGRFSMPSTNPGTQPLQVTAPGLSRHLEQLTLLPGSKHDIQVHLRAGVTVRGVVRTSSDTPIANASVTTSPNTTLARYATTAADGTYTIVGAAPGELPIQVEGGSFDTVNATLQVVDGQTVQWDPVIAVAGASLRGRVFDANEQPVEGAYVSAYRSRRHAGRWTRTGKTDATGRFELPNCDPGVPLYVKVIAGKGPQVRADAVLPEKGEHIIRMPAPVTVHIRGILLDDHGKPLPNVSVWAARRGSGSRHMTNDLETGAFAFELEVAGEYMVWIRPAGFAPFCSKRRALGDQDSWDLGELRMTRGGTVRIAITGDYTNFPDRYLAIRGQGDNNGHGVQIEDGTGIAGPLAQGDYQLQIEGADVAAKIVPFSIREGVQTQLDVAVQRGTPTVLQVEARPGSPPPMTARVTVTNAAGELVQRRSPWRREGKPLEVQTMLLPGKYRVEVNTEADEIPGRFGAIELLVGTEPVTKRIELAPRD